MCLFFFFNDTATTEIYTLSLHDALPISQVAGRPLRTGRGDRLGQGAARARRCGPRGVRVGRGAWARVLRRSEEHTSELQSRSDLVCRLLLEKKKKPTQSPDSNPRICVQR